MPRPIEKKKRVIKPYVKPTDAEFNKFILIDIVLFALSGLVFFTSGTTMIFWLFFVLGIVLAFNIYWLKQDYAQSFLIRFGLTMLKTKKLIGFINGIAKHGKWFEKICLAGVMLGFGLVAVDYWYARKLGGLKRIALLAVSAVILGLIYVQFLSILFMLPILAPLFIPCMIGFIVLGFGGMSLMMLVGYGFLSFMGLFVNKQMCPSVAPVLPGIEIPGLGVPIPLIGWISLAFVLIIHEMSHGIMMSYYKEKIKSVGILLAGIIPVGAFVEQDDKTFEVLDDKKAMLVLSAGSASNLLTILVAWVLLIGLVFAVGPFGDVIEQDFAKTYSGVKIVKVQDTVSFCGIDANAPAKGKLFVGDVIKQINGIDVNSIGGINQNFLKSKGDINFTVERVNPDTNKKNDVNVSITPFLFEDLGIKRIGVEFGAIPTGYQMKPELFIANSIISEVSMILLLLLIISFAAGSFNYFPSDPFDGGRMAKIMLAPYFGFMRMNQVDTHKLIGRLFIWILILSLTFNMIPYLTMFF
jgi:hypothetical protein